MDKNVDLCLLPCSQVGQDGVRRALSLRACSYPRASVTREFLMRLSLYFLIESPFIPASVPGFHCTVLLGLPDFLSG